MARPRVPDAAMRSGARRLFGEDPAGYDAGRLAYPERVYEILIERCGLTTGSCILEIGPGTGRAARRPEGPRLVLRTAVAESYRAEASKDPTWRLTRSHGAFSSSGVEQ